MENVGKRDRVVLGDETGIVKGFFWGNEAFKVGNTVVLFKAEAPVIREHIELQNGKADIARREVREVNKANDISAKEWVEQS